MCGFYVCCVEGVVVLGMWIGRRKVGDYLDWIYSRFKGMIVSIHKLCNSIDALY